jgi:hypothetical protein
MKNLLLVLALGLGLASCEKEPIEEVTEEVNVNDANITCGVFNGKRSYTSSGDRYIDIKCEPKDSWHIQHQGNVRTLDLIDKSIYYNIKENTEVCFKHDIFGSNLGVVSYTTSEDVFIGNSNIVYISSLPCNDCSNN